MARRETLRHQLDHLFIGVLVFVAGALYQRTHAFHHKKA